MPTYKVKVNGETLLVPAKSIVEITNFLHKEGLTGTITKVNENSLTKVSVTCGWGNQTHKWETTKAEAIAHKNVCPNHRR